MTRSWESGLELTAELISQKVILLFDRMAERSGSFASVSAEGDVKADLEFKPLSKEELYLNDIFELYFQLPDPNRCPSYLDVIRLAPLHETMNLTSKKARHAITFSYCRWNIENGDGQFSIRVKGKVSPNPRKILLGNYSCESRRLYYFLFSQ